MRKANITKRLISTGILWLLILNVVLVESISIPNYEVSDNSELNNESEITIDEARVIFPGFGNYFTENKGQIDNDDVLYYLHGSVAFTKNSVIFNVRESKLMPPQNLLDYSDFKRENNTNVRVVVFLVRFENSNDVIPKGLNKLSHRGNYFLGNDSTKWRTNIANYESIIYPNIYDGIDLVYRIKDGFLKYDFVVYPNANPIEICLTYEGIDGLAINSDDSLLIRTALGELTDTKPYVFQELNSTKVEVTSTFTIINKRSKHND